MVKRFFEFQDDVRSYLNNLDESKTLQREVAELMPNNLEVLLNNQLFNDLKDFNDVSLELQKKDGSLSLLDVRHIFDELIEKYGNDFRFYLHQDADIVCNKDFEKAIVQALISEDKLSDSQKQCLECFEQHDHDGSGGGDSDQGEGKESENFAQRSLKRKRAAAKKVMYLDLAQLPVTSNIVERFFSEVKINLTYLRNRLLPSTLETIMFLKMNSPFWNKMTVHKAIRNINLKN